MRLLYVHGTQIDAEAANNLQVINMCDAFQQCGVEVVLAIAAPKADRYRHVENIEILFGREMPFEIRLFEKFTVGTRFNVLGSYFGAKRAISACDADVYFVRDPLLLNLAIGARKATIYESHNHLVHDRSRLLNRWWSARVIRNSESKHLLKFVTISKALSDYWRSQGVRASKLMALHDGFDAARFSERMKLNDAKRLVGLPVDRKVVTYCGSLYPNREPERIIELARTFPNVTFVVLGGPLARKRELEQQSHAANVRNILWKGHVPHGTVPNFLFASDVLLMIWSAKVLTIKYFSSLKLFEYMAAGRPIVGQAFPTVKEVLTDGLTAHLADPTSFEDLSRKVGLALEHTGASEMADRARSLAFSQYSWKSRAEAILQSI
jgi:glycosyltransferase involved in cell wall biosynthesis